MILNAIKIVFCASVNFQQISNIFISSLEPLILEEKIELLEKTIDVTEFNNVFGFRTPSWRYSIISKLEHALFTLENNAKENEYIVVCDTDIQFLNPKKLLSLVNQAIIKELDFYGIYERQNKKVFYNGGFYILKNCKKVRIFYRNFVKQAKQSKNRLIDQEILSKMLLIEDSGLKHEHIPTEYVVLGDRGLHINNILHHAIGRKQVFSKLKLMKNIKRKYNNLLKTTSHRLEL